MRQLSEGAVAALSEQHGLEPVSIIEVNWAGNKKMLYADKDVDGIPGKILQVSQLDGGVAFDSSSSQSITVVLDDADGTIKKIMDRNDIHQRDVAVYQYFTGMPLADKVLLFTGKIYSPVVWSEGDRTVTFSIVSQIEDNEIGFSAEEGDFPWVPKNMIGKAWPIIFGKCLDVPALQVNEAVTGTTLCGVGILSGQDLHNAVPLGGSSCADWFGLAGMLFQAHHLSFVANAFQSAGMEAEYDRHAKQARDILQSVSDQVNQRSRQDACARAQRENTIADAENNGLGCNPIRILGGEDFPQHRPITLNINGGLFTGIMDGNNFTVSIRRHPDNEEKAQKIFDRMDQFLCRGSSNPPTPPTLDAFTEVPCGHGDLGGCGIHTFGVVTCMSDGSSPPTLQQVAQHFWAEAGSRVSIASNEPITYIVSITPGTVLDVKAYKQFTGVRKLVSVPRELWSVNTKDYGPVTAVQVTLVKPLSTIPDQGWGDDIYVTFQSDIGPNTVDILEYIIERWTDLEVDTASFNAVRSKVNPFPMNFPILGRRNTVEVLREIAFQARCALWLNQGKVYIKYLPEEPEVDTPLTVSDILHQSMSIELTPTEDIVTKLTAVWRLSWADGNGEQPEKIILRHNINKYGTKKEEYDFYCFNQPDIVLKAATFWLIRKSNTWKKVKIRTPIKHLPLEMYDTVQLPAGYASTSPCKAVIESAVFDSEAFAMEFTCLTPVKSGMMEPYKFFWPAKVSDTFPTTEEIRRGNAGGLHVIDVLPIGNTDLLKGGGTVFVGGPNIVFGAHSTRGDRRPGDVGFTAQEVIHTSVYANVTNIQNPNPNLQLNYRGPYPPVQNPVKTDSVTVIDINKTRIIDSARGREVGYLKSVIESVKGGNLYLKKKLNVKDGETEGPFEFKYDAEGEKFGSERAFLIPDEGGEGEGEGEGEGGE